MAEYPFIDLHCDVVNNYISNIQYLTSGIRWAKKLEYNFLIEQNDPLFMVDFPRMKKSGLKASVFAIHAPLVYDGNPLHRALSLAEKITQIIEKTPAIDIICDRESFNDSIENDDIAILLSLENGDVFNRDLNIIYALFRYGFRVCTLAWYGRNCICDAGHESDSVGLSYFGKKAVKEMNDLGMLIDISHMNPAGSMECIELTGGKGVFASHSNCYSLCKSKRNISDDVLKALAEVNSCVGITLVPRFLSNKKTGKSPSSSIYEGSFG